MPATVLPPGPARPQSRNRHSGVERERALPGAFDVHCFAPYWIGSPRRCGFVARTCSALGRCPFPELGAQRGDESCCAVERRGRSEHGIVGSLERDRGALLAEPARVATAEVG